MKRADKIRILPTILFVFLFLVLASWQYRWLCILILILVNRNWIRSRAITARRSWPYPLLIIVSITGFYSCLPNYFQRGRTQLAYLDQGEVKTHPPVEVYAANVLFPEKELANLGILGAAMLPADGMTVAGHKIAGWLLESARRNFWRGKMRSFYTPYHQLVLQGSRPGSAAFAQFFNERFDKDYSPFYLTRPAHWVKEKEYPLVVFCHGYLGNWEMYQGILSGLKECVVLSIGTHDLSGVFHRKDIEDIFARYVPCLEERGFVIDPDQIHLIGLSNGGSASDCALRDFSDRFKSVTYISTGCHAIKKSKARVLLVGGSEDPSSAGLVSAKTALDGLGTDCRMLYLQGADHFLLATHRKEMTAFLKQGMEL